jgi:hypothetical protein
MWMKWGGGSKCRLKSCRCDSLPSPHSQMLAGFPWRLLGTQAPRPTHRSFAWHLHTHQWRWIVQIVANLSAVLIGQFSSLLQEGGFLVQWMLSSESSLGLRSANFRKEFNYTKKWPHLYMRSWFWLLHSFFLLSSFLVTGKISEI